MSALFDFYGPLLTDKQNRCLQMHLLEDFSLSEISAELGISRQAVYDMLKRSEQIMQQYEDKLGLAARSIQEKKELYAILNDLMKIKQDLHDDRLNGIIENINSDKGRVTVKIEIFGRSTPTELEFSKVKKL